MKKRSRLEKFLPVVLSAVMLTFVAACGSDDDDDNSRPTTTTQPEQPEPEEQQQPDEGTFRAELQPLNSSVGGNTVGTANIKIEGDELRFDMVVNGAPANITHIQHIHAGTACPTSAEDVNGDGFVDVLEGLPRYGAILVPLDGDLETQEGGTMTNPSANATGTYRYTERASLTRMLADLRAPDTDTTDAVIKLEPGQALNLASRHIVVHGIPATPPLPASVGTLGDTPSNATLPIACGIITRVTDGGTTGGTGGGTTGGTTGGATTGGTTGGETTGGTTGGETTGGTTGTTIGGTAGTTIGGTAGTTIGGNLN